MDIFERVKTDLRSRQGEEFLYTPFAGAQFTATGVPDFGSNPEASLAAIIYRMWVDLADFTDTPINGEGLEYQGSIYSVVNVAVQFDNSAWLTLEKNR